MSNYVKRSSRLSLRQVTIWIVLPVALWAALLYGIFTLSGGVM